MSRKRVENRRAARCRQSYRRSLVHSAGCVWRGEGLSECSTVLGTADVAFEAYLMGIRFPRSLRYLEREAKAEAQKRGLA